MDDARISRMIAARDQASDARGLVDLLKEPEVAASDSWRFVVMKKLAKLGGPDAADAFVAALDQDPDQRIASLAVDQLERLAVPNGVDALIRALRHPTPLIRARAARCLGRLRVQQATDALIAALEDEHWLVRGKAALALGEIEDKRAVPAVIERLRDDDRSVRLNAGTALVQLGDAGAAEAMVRVARTRGFRINPGLRLKAHLLRLRLRRPRTHLK